MPTLPTPLKTQRFVVKLGGEIMLNTAGLDALSADIAALAHQGVSIVLVHGGGPQADTLADRLGHTVRKVAGRRVTGDDALEVAKMVYGGSINLELLASLLRHGARPVGLSGVDAGLIQVRKRPPVHMTDPKTGTEDLVDFGHVGDVVGTNPALLNLLLGGGYVPVVASLAADLRGNLYNVNADTIAQTLAVALNADRLILMTNVPGILRDPSDPASLIPTLTVDDLRALIAGGTISGGMTPKAQNCIQAIEAGVKAVQILSGTTPESTLLRSLTTGGTGTVITT
jgi:acetylglutamate kinase